MNTEESAHQRQIIADNIGVLRNRIAVACDKSHRPVSDVKIIAVTKNVSAYMVRIAYANGFRDFGENRIQEAVKKFAELRDIRSDIALHLVGHLQTNKAKDALDAFDIIHSLDSLKLAEQLNSRATMKAQTLLQVNIASEVTKHGFSGEEVVSAIASIGRLPNIEIRGLMTIAPIAADPEEVRPIFANLRRIKESLGLIDLSMGMTDDFQVAIEEGATMVRIGRAIFGDRRFL